MEKKDLYQLNHMLDAAKTIQKHIKGKKQSDLDNDRLFLGGVIRELLLSEKANPSQRLHYLKTLFGFSDNEVSKLVLW